MLYSFRKEDKLRELPPVTGLEFCEVEDPLLFSIIGKISVREATNRLANDHKAFLAFKDKQPAAFGWMAMGKARIGELNHEFILPIGHRYLWNFRTLPDYRGKGIYPHLLQFIINSEKNNSECFWILHAPENKASEKGILKTGFKFMGKVSVKDFDNVIFEPANPFHDPEEVLETLGFENSNEPPDTCWNCSSPFLSKRKQECCCSTNNMVCNGQILQLA